MINTEPYYIAICQNHDHTRLRHLLDLLGAYLQIRYLSTSEGASFGHGFFAKLCTCFSFEKIRSSYDQLTGASWRRDYLIPRHLSGWVLIAVEFVSTGTKARFREMLAGFVYVLSNSNTLSSSSLVRFNRYEYNCGNSKYRESGWTYQIMCFRTPARLVK